MKICSHCSISKEIQYYSRNKNSSDGYEPRCKQCTLDYKNSRKTQTKEYDKKYKLINKNKIRLYENQYHLNNRDKKIRYVTIYSKLNRNKINIRVKNRLKQDPKIRLIHNLRVRIRYAIKNNKVNSSINYLGCNVEDYKLYIESKFNPEMSWDNYGKIWEIDHIIPISSFNFEIQEDIFKCFHYINTQPLFKTTKIAKQFGYFNYIGNRDKSDNYECRKI